MSVSSFSRFSASASRAACFSARSFSRCRASAVAAASLSASSWDLASSADCFSSALRSRFLRAVCLSVSSFSRFSASVSFCVRVCSKRLLVDSCFSKSFLIVWISTSHFSRMALASEVAWSSCKAILVLASLYILAIRTSAVCNLAASSASLLLASSSAAASCASISCALVFISRSAAW